MCCLHIWFGNACCNVPFDCLSLVKCCLPAAASSPCQSSTMSRDEGVYTHSSKLCASETHVTVIGLFTIVIKFSQSETNAWNSGHVDLWSTVSKGLFCEAGWVWKVNQAVTLILKYFPLPERFNNLFLSKCLDAEVSQCCYVKRNIILLGYAAGCRVANFYEGLSAAIFGTLLFCVLFPLGVFLISSVDHYTVIAGID